uniref:Protein phosphatase 1 regulatory subunit 36 n=1 Tax=Ovis aries TaxID=9940 RepID=A0AC11EUQ3_SHEEP
MPRICSFTTFMRNKNLDNFLMALLYYLYYYLEKISQEKKPKSYMVGLVEKKEMEVIISKLEAAQKYLAQKYCVLVLGLGMPDKHHMSCGKGKISDTQKDWKFFESFYTFCTYVAWIVFRRQHFTEIEEEIGRLFRSNMFNIPRRKREDEESGGEKKRMTFVQFRRMMAKRPAIKKAINMRSPVMSTLLPSLREKAQNVSQKKYRQIGAKFPAQMQEPRETLDSLHMPMWILYQQSQQGKSKNTGVGSLSLLQGIFPIQELNWGLLHYWWVLYQLSYQGRPMLVRLCSTSFKLDFSST